MTTKIPTQNVGRSYNPNDATSYDDDSVEARIYAAVKRSSVKIDVLNPVPGNSRNSGHASGTVVTRDGIVVTDGHCVTDPDGRPLPDDQITVTVNGRQYHAHVLTDANGLGIRSDQSALQILAPAGETFTPLRIASSVRPDSRQWVFGYPQDSNVLFMSPVQSAQNGNPDTSDTRGDLGAKMQPGEDPNRKLHRSPVHIEPGNSGGARVQIGADGQPEMIEMAEITNTNITTENKAATELAGDQALHLRDNDTANWVDDDGTKHSGLYKERREYLQNVLANRNSGWFTPRHDIVAFLDDVTGRRFAERTDVAPPGGGDWTKGWVASQHIVGGRIEPAATTARDQEAYGTIADQILKSHAKSSVESFYLKQFMGEGQKP